MKFLKILLIIVVVLIILFFAGGLFLPKTYSVSRSIKIKSTDSLIYKNISDLNAFKLWVPWLKMEPTAKIDIAGTPSTVGHSYHWTGDKTGEGIMTINQAEPYSLVVFDLKFIKPFESNSITTFDVSPDGDSTKVVWSMNGENKSTMEKWMSLNFDNMIGKDFNNGLASLKTLSEGGK